MSAWTRTLPLYKDLADGTAFTIFGPEDHLGCLNLLTDERVKAAKELIVTGQVVNVNASLNWPDPPPFGVGIRGKPVHNVIKYENARDDYLDAFYPQSGSQWDGFLHQRDPERETFYNNNTDESLGIQLWAERGIAGRGVLLDVERYVQSQGRILDWTKRETFSVADLENTAAAQGVTITEGTILLIRLGWESGFNAATPEERVAASSVEPARKQLPGVEGSAEMTERLWDWGVAAVASDSVAFEAYPPDGYFMHIDLLCRVGIPIGEMWSLAALADACTAAGRYEFFLTSAPLNLPGGIGSTANALAIL